MVNSTVQCPQCKTWLDVTQEQLDAHHGLIRCGFCNTVFNAAEQQNQEKSEPLPASQNAAPELVRQKTWQTEIRPAEPQKEQQNTFGFSGDGKEYFRIWIVNLCLSIITLGIYSAWAKVRRLQYFYRHTSIAGASFDYHGDPVAILKGRIIAVGVFALYSFSRHLGVTPALIALLLLLALMPWLLVRSFRFRLHNTSYRGLRLAFRGKTGGGYVNFLLWPLLSVFTAYTLWPLVRQRISRYLIGNSAYGNQHFAFLAGDGVFYRPYIVVFGSSIVLVLIGFVLALIGAGGIHQPSPAADPKAAAAAAMVVGIIFYIVIFILFRLAITPYLAARLQNLTWNNTTLGSHRFESRLRARSMIGITITNFILIVFTLGLFKPFADIRLMRYRLECLSLFYTGSLDEFVANAQTDVSATGEEMADIFDMDISL